MGAQCSFSYEGVQFLCLSFWCSIVKGLLCSWLQNRGTFALNVCCFVALLQSTMLSNHPLLNSILLSKCVINIFQFIPARHLVLWIQWMSGSFRLGTFLQRIWLWSYDVSDFICFSDSSSFTSVEVAETFGTNFATMNVHSSQRGVYKIGILPRWRQYIWFTAANFSNFYLLFIFVSGNIGWLQRINKTWCFEINVSHIPVIHLVKYLWRGSLSRSRRMSLLRLCALDVSYFHNIPSWIIKLLLFERTSAWNIIDV